MAQANLQNTSAGIKQVTITRIFNAPRELVWQAWTEPKHLTQWWGPNGFTCPYAEVDLRPGGVMDIHMRGPDGVTYPNKGVIEELVEFERLVTIGSGFEDEAGNPQLEVRNALTLSEEGGKTRLTLQATVLRATPALAAAISGMDEGWEQTIDHLEEYLGML